MGFLLEGPSMEPFHHFQNDLLKKNQNAFKWIIFPMRNIFLQRKQVKGRKVKNSAEENSGYARYLVD